MQQPRVALPLMFILAAIATTLPVFAGYVMGFSFVVWMLVTGHWRLARLGKKHLPAPGQPDYALMQAIAAAMKPLHWGVLALVVGHLIAALLGCAWSPWAKPLGRTLAVWSHTAVKVGLLWYVVSAAMIIAARLKWQPRRIGPFFLAWLCVQFLYCVLQHQTGVDWTHGFHAVLGSHRFAYGVYRVSGFMGHPLTFAYNHMVILLAAAAMAWRLNPRFGPLERKLWYAIMAVCTLTLLISGSRYVLLVLGAALVLCEGRRLWRARRWLLAFGLAAAAVLWLEGSVVGRFSELFMTNVAWTERFPRLVFWSIHWQMFLDQPLFGMTMAGIDDALTAYYTAAGYHDNMYTAHNLVLQYLADTGLIGGAGLALWFSGLLLARRRLSRLLGSAQGVGYVATGTALCALMQNNLRDSAYIYALWFFLSLLIVQSADLYAHLQQSDSDERKPPENLQPRTDPADSAADL